jgi:hypothetical protein
MTRPLFGSIFAFSMTCFPLLAASNVSTDEVAVRSAYAAVVLRSQIASIYASYGTDHLSTDRQLTAEISGLHAGVLAEILSTPLSKLVTVPTGELLLSTPGSFSLDGRAVASFLEVQNWGPVNARYNFNHNYAVFDAPVSALLSSAVAGPGPPYNRYLAFSVSLSAHGRERSYQALALFREGERAARIIDDVLSSPEELIGKNIVKELTGLPANLAAADLTAANKTKLDEFLNSLAMTGSCSTDSTTQLCCDADSKLCGISAHAFTPGQR